MCNCKDLGGEIPASSSSGGITSINGNTNAAQTIMGAGSAVVHSMGGVTTVTVPAGSGITSINMNTDAAQTIMGTGATTVSSSGGITTVYTPLSLTQTVTQWTPEFLGSLATTTYSVQSGLAIATGNLIDCSFQMVVNTYESSGPFFYILMNLPAAAQTTYTQNQFVNLTCVQGIEDLVSTLAFTSISVPCFIAPGASQMQININFTVEPGDLWQGNFSYIVG